MWNLSIMTNLNQLKCVFFFIEMVGNFYSFSLAEVLLQTNSYEYV